MHNFEDALLVARYLIESNNEDYQQVDENKTQSIGIIKEIFKKLVSKYKLLNAEE